ncbi:MAG: hypothetical protein HKN87_01615 [Saprospiraceae bacterium]|nr:hypothetical protein [Saprospiraceae bacterium]
MSSPRPKPANMPMRQLAKKQKRVEKVKSNLLVVCVISILPIIGMYLVLLKPKWLNSQERFITYSKRPSVTFIMGVDKPGQQYFGLAEHHFLWHPDESTMTIVKSCRDLSSVLSYLNTHASDTEPWGIINIVLHGNVWSGLSLAMWPEGPRAYPKELFRAARENRFPRLDNQSVDEETRVSFWACGIGKNPLINLALREICTTGEVVRPNVFASPHFVLFKAKDEYVERYAASYWPYFFKRGYRPSISEIDYDHSLRFPEANVDWSAILMEDQQTSTENICKEEFHIPVSCTVLYEDNHDRPSVGSIEEQMTWIRS